MKIIFPVIISLLFFNSTFAHESPKPIDISCSLNNYETVDRLQRKKIGIQYLTYSVSMKVLEEHFDFTKGRKIFVDTLSTFIPVEVVIKTSSGNLKKTGSIHIIIPETGGNPEIVQYVRQTGFRKSENIFFMFDDVSTFKNSMQNEIISCKILP